MEGPHHPYACGIAGQAKYFTLNGICPKQFHKPVSPQLGSYLPMDRLDCEVKVRNLRVCTIEDPSVLHNTQLQRIRRYESGSNICEDYGT
jgi:hypothetical protein